MIKKFCEGKMKMEKNDIQIDMWKWDFDLHSRPVGGRHAPKEEEEEEFLLISLKKY